MAARPNHMALPFLLGTVLFALACASETRQELGSSSASTGASDGTSTSGGGSAVSDASPEAPIGLGGFSPCPSNGTPCAIMPLGDSITFADLAPGAGYRVELFHQSLVNLQNITFVGSQMNGPPTVDGKPFPNQSEGHSGYVISGGANGISELTDASLAKYKPNIVLLMIGTNDVAGNRDLANAPARLGALLDQIVRGAPSALLVVAKIVPTKTDALNTRVQMFNAAIGPLVEQRVGAGKHIAMVDMYAALTANANYKTELLRDELHPTLVGYQVMGRTWYAAIRDVLPGQP
jgi:lysophospholipase L1-like esterase